MGNEIEIIEGGCTAAKGFKAAGCYCGIGGNEEKGDLAMIVSDVPAAAASTFTKNKVKASHIAVTKEHIRNGRAQAVICNSGNANSCAPNGIEASTKICGMAASQLGIDEDDVLPASTGIIGVELPTAPFEKAVPGLVSKLSYDGSHEAALAIMTTDTVPKEAAVSFTIGGKKCAIGGIAKGSGMIHINMGTMLCFITTDAAISPEMLQKALSAEILDSFNQISVDGDTSTNDTVDILANGMAGNEEIVSEGPDLDTFRKALHEVCVMFARKLAGDGEGAGKLLEAEVTGAPNVEAARTAAKSVVSSNLVKAAVFGEDANWGRILCAIGYSDADFSVDNVDVVLVSAKGRIDVCKASKGLGFDEEKAAEIMSEHDIKAFVDLHDGDASASAWGCDLTYDYVKINGEYRS
ncbi:MAG: bifunctional glutamate N-acetyltransferase/amino-acid acetyltransferase ArgJ [Anaerovoracaceae bacterium]